MPSLFLENGAEIEERKGMVRLFGELQLHEAVIALQFLASECGVAIARVASNPVDKTGLGPEAKDTGQNLLVNTMCSADGGILATEAQAIEHSPASAWLASLPCAR
jgi:hypothetical protein